MSTPKQFSPEVKERAVRLVREHQSDYETQRAAIKSITGKIGCAEETRRQWVRRAERDAGRRPGLTTDEGARLQARERENRELRQANEILRKASVDSMGQRNRSSKRAAGVSKSGVLRGRAFSLAAT